MYSLKDFLSLNIRIKDLIIFTCLILFTMIRVFHQIEFSTFPSWETYKNKYVGLKFDVEFEFEEKMTTFFSGKKVSLDINFEIFKFRDFSKKIQIEIFAKPTQFFYF